MENSLGDLVGVFGFIKPGLFRQTEVKTLSTRGARQRIEPYMLRRRKEDALPDLPPKVLDTKWIDLTGSQRRAYDQAEAQGVNRLKHTPDVTLQHVLALITELKQICNFNPINGESSKLEFLHAGFLEQACQQDGKVLIFSQYVKTLEELNKHLASMLWKP